MRWTVERLLAELARLDGEPADALEGETLEIKSRPKDPQQLRSWAVEAAVCLANAVGGTLLVGVADRTVGAARAVVGCGNVDVPALRRTVYDSTDPSILVDIEFLDTPHGRLLAVHVPAGLPPHTTSNGLALIRVGSACVPLSGSMWRNLASRTGGVDRSAERLPDVRPADLDPRAIERMRLLLRGRQGLEGLDRRTPTEILDRLGLLHRSGDLTLAAALLAADERVLRDLVPQHEVNVLRMSGATRYDARLDTRAPLLVVLEAVEERLDLWLPLRTITPLGFQQLELRDVATEVVREAVLNAVAHRDYFVHRAVTVAVHPDRVVVESPGGFLGGITPANVLRHGHVHRNERLCEALQHLGLVNRAGIGVERMYEGLLRQGNRPPRYDATESLVQLGLPRRGHDGMAAWVLERQRRGEPLSVDDLILLRRLCDVATLDRWAAAQHLQLDEHEAALRLADLRRRGHLVVRGRGRAATYTLPRALAVRLRGQGATDADVPLEEEGVRLRLLQLLVERGRLTNSEIRAFSGYSRQEVLRLMKALQAGGLIEMHGTGRGAHLVPTNAAGALTGARSEPARRGSTRPG